LVEQKKEDLKWRKTNFGPEETKERIERRKVMIERQRTYMKQELEKQIKVLS